MATTDYNKLKKLEATSQNDSGATIDKAQPIQVIGEVTPKEFDGFEDGDYTASPQWTETETNGAATVQSTTVAKGSNSLEISTSGNGPHTLQHDRGTSDSISDGDQYQFWVRSDTSLDNAAFALSNTSGDELGDDAIYVGLNRSLGQFRIITRDGTGSTIVSKFIGNAEADTWYRFIVTLNPSTSDGRLEVLDANDVLLASENFNTSGATNIQYTILDKDDTVANNVFFDNISYSEVDASSPTLSEGKTGNGGLVLDWTNIGSESDIAVYDQDGNLLPYEIESFDATAETATLWCYNSWVRDDSVQAQIVYGDGPTSSEENVSGTWNNTGQNAVMVQHLNDNPLTSTDSTSNNNDGTVTGVSSITNAEFNGGADFDGVDDDIGTGFTVPDSSSFTANVWVNMDSLSNSNGVNDEQTIVSAGWGGNFDSTYRLKSDSNGVSFQLYDGSVNEIVDSNAASGEWANYIMVFDAANGVQKLYKNGALLGENTGISTPLGQGSTEELTLGDYGPDSTGYDDSPYDGKADEFKYYNQEVKDSYYAEAEYDASPKAGQVFFSQQAAETTVTGKTASIPETQLTASNPDPSLNASNKVTVPETTTTATNPDPQVQPGTAPITVQETQLTSSNPAPTLEPGTANLQIATPTNLTASNPDPDINATFSLSVPETQLNETQPNPTLTVGQTILAPETQLNAENPDFAVQAGEATINTPETVLTVENPEIGLNLRIVFGTVTELTASNPEPNIEPGIVQVNVPKTQATTINPSPQLVPGETTVQTTPPSQLTVFQPDIELTGGDTTLSVDPTDLTVTNPEISVAIDIVPRDSNLTFNIDKSESITVSGDINK